MTQLFNVVRCFQCSIYQVDIEKKSTNKWMCKLCGSKQSLRQVFFNGDSKECREKVQLLNQLSGSAQEAEKFRKMENISNQQNSYQMSDKFGDKQVTNDKPRVSKWAKYLTNDSDEEN